MCWCMLISLVLRRTEFEAILDYLVALFQEIKIQIPMLSRTPIWILLTRKISQRHAWSQQDRLYSLSWRGNLVMIVMAGCRRCSKEHSLKTTTLVRSLAFATEFQGKYKFGNYYETESKCFVFKHGRGKVREWLERESLQGLGYTTTCICGFWGYIAEKMSFITRFPY